MSYTVANCSYCRTLVYQPEFLSADDERAAGLDPEKDWVYCFVCKEIREFVRVPDLSDL